MTDWRTRFKEAAQRRMDYIESPSPAQCGPHIPVLRRGYFDGTPITFLQCAKCFDCPDYPYKYQACTYVNNREVLGPEKVNGLRPAVVDDAFMALPLADDRWFNSAFYDHGKYSIHRKKILDKYKEEWWEIYNQYLASPEWAAKCAARFALSGGRCFGGMDGCTGKAEHCHHLGKRHDSGGTGAYEFAGNEPLFLLVSLCFSCHNQIHDGKLLEDSHG